MGQLKGRGSFGGEFRVSHCNQWGLLLCSCVEMCEPIELLFGVVSGIGPCFGVLDVVNVLQQKVGGFQEVSRSFSPIRFNGVLLNRKYYSCMKS